MLFRSRIAERYFHPYEIAQLSKLEGPEKLRRFYEYWTYKEAFLKALGGTIFDLKTYSVHTKGDMTASPVILEREGQSWQLIRQSLFDSYVSAVSVSGEAPVQIEVLHPQQIQTSQ